MTWEDFIQQSYRSVDENIIMNREPTTILCPKCGRMIYRRTDIVLTTYPLQYQYECVCGWVGYSNNRWIPENENAEINHLIEENRKLKSDLAWSEEARREQDMNNRPQEMGCW